MDVGQCQHTAVIQLSLTDPIITGRSSGVTGNGLRANGWLAGGQIDGHSHFHSHLSLSTTTMTIAANPLILRAMELNAHKAFRLLKRAQLHLRAVKAVEAVWIDVGVWVEVKLGMQRADPLQLNDVMRCDGKDGQDDCRWTETK